VPLPSPPEKRFVTLSTIRDNTPGCSDLRVDRGRVVRLAVVARFEPPDVRDELRGDLAAELFVAFPRLEVLPDIVPRAELEPRPLPFDLPRAEAVRDEDDFDAPLEEAELPLFAPVREEIPARLLPDDLEPPRALEDLLAELPPLRPVELLPRLVELPPRPDELLLRPLLELFLVEEPPRDDLPAVDDLLPADDLPPEEVRLPLDVLRDEDEPPFLPAALFFDDVLFEPPLEDLDELELFFEPPLLLLDPEDKREPDDFLVVAMLFTLQYFVWYLPAPATVSNICADLKNVRFYNSEVMRQIESAEVFSLSLRRGSSARCNNLSDQTNELRPR